MIYDNNNNGSSLFISDKKEKRIKYTIRKIDQNKSSRKQDINRKVIRTQQETYK